MSTYTSDNDRSAYPADISPSKSNGSISYNPTPHLIPEGDNAVALEVTGSTATDKLIIIMVGLPATGKTYIAKRICRYITFFHDIPAQIFNSSNYRRKLFGVMPANFFDHSNAEGLAQRTTACNAALDDLVDYMKKDGVRVSVYDATCSTRERRDHVLKKLVDENLHCNKMFVESICEEEEFLEENIRELKLSTPDYHNIDPDDAAKDFNERREQYKAVYEPLDDRDGSYLTVFNYCKFMVNKVRGYLPLKVVHFIMNLHTLPRTFYLSRHGQSEYNDLAKIGGDSGLTKAGLEYARRLANFCKDEISVKTVIDPDTDKEVKKEIPARLWTSTMQRTKETAQFIDHSPLDNLWDNGEKREWLQFRPRARRNLDEIYAGICDGLSYKEIEEQFPDEFARRQKDKLSYRYPRGESYMDVILRLEPLAHELERIREPILIIAHQGIHRILYAYFMGLDRAQAPYISIPLNTVIQLTPHAYGCHEKRISLMQKSELKCSDDGQDEPVTNVSMSESFSKDNVSSLNMSSP
mmetsp:Transcript_63069/g.73785  ORF Transcript_63069/g.73785 Transcript_63069/m.73785 type:complete len:525 (-) Transcript_63069:249-1823(-)